MQQALRQPGRVAADLLALPSKYGKLYEEFIVSNASSIGSIESALRSLTYIVPGRFRDAEIASESLHSGVQLLSLYHNSLLARAVARLPKAQQPHPSPHNRYTQYWTKNSSAYRRLALTVQVIQYTELLCEMAAKRRGEAARWRVVTILESLKALCRLLLLRLTNSRPLLSPPLPEREIDPSTLEDGASNNPPDIASPPSERSEETQWTMPRTGLSLPTLPSSGDISSYLLSKVLTADDVKPPKALLHRVSGLGEFAEVLYILRPVVYAFAMAHYARRGKSAAWQPWLLGVAMEYGARQLAKRDVADRRAGGLRGLTALEKDELKKRGWGLAWWAMRGAFYEQYTSRWIHGVSSSLKGKPLLDMVGGIIEDYEFLWDQYYFPTATI
ncbi:peroxisome membrane protein [Myriangium duriaei CBS 260.36]|uniref:Peroxisomal membrane protein PEX16 n=1 Tax=Myriangium duriaei CBS 260.36 TaxID=1168546 RepID=A0A9P4MPK3_9PEZI|nr:peroxisome membrane protein [Myriangium duriaei CBS 260.36]